MPTIVGRRWRNLSSGLTLLYGPSGELLAEPSVSGREIDKLDAVRDLGTVVKLEILAPRSGLQNKRVYVPDY